jgi:uncharacterized protein (DUF433 family)
MLLDPVVVAFRHGDSPETIARELSRGLTLEQVYGAISYYLANRPEIDEYLNQYE